ncbi:hypothetical protein L6452_43677 [Arctium lappa]|uniref:Uncharacterized protein n=1 Tax=Arctium lappa TaxID=4217 RepID=A0ACB8XDK8_ARCLA|nr:hypothetical protein L6452_43677 [Arctium lappa]
MDGSSDSVLVSKVPMLRSNEFDMRKIRIRKYILLTDYSMWDIIENGPSNEGKIGEDGKRIPPKTDGERKIRQTEMKALSTLLLATPNEYQHQFCNCTDAQMLWNDLEKRLSGTKSTKRNQKAILKQLYENFMSTKNESMTQTFDRFIKMIGELATVGMQIDQDDVNKKFLRLFEAEVEAKKRPSGYTHNAALLSSSSSTDSAANTESVSTVIHANSGLINDDLEQINADDLEEMDIKWQMAMLTMRVKRFIKRTGRNNFSQRREDGAGFDKSKVECYKCHKMGHFAKECRGGIPQQHGSNHQQAHSSSFQNNINFTQDLFSQEGMGFDWSDQAEEVVQNQALMAVSSDCTKAYKANELQHYYGTNYWKWEKNQLEIQIEKSKEEYEKIKSEYEKAKLDIEKFSYASKAMDSLLKAQVHDKIRVVWVPKIKKVVSTATSNSTADRNNADVSNSTANPISTANDVSTANKVSTANQGNQQLKGKSIWHVDSGCSRHMTGNKSCLQNFKRIDGGHVAFGDNPSEGKISGNGILSKGFKVVDESMILLRTPRKDNVYCLDLENVSNDSSFNCLFSKASVDESSLWHRRMCHMNFKTMNKLVKNNLVRGLPQKVFSYDDHCIACLKGKQHKSSHKSKEINTISTPLQLLHMDLFGPTNVMSIGKKSYCLVIVGDFSRFTWVYFLRKKDETNGLIKSFILRVENQTNQRVKIIRSDNGTEFKNHDLNNFCEEEGIERQYSAPRTPQQNGVVERRNRTLIEAVRSLLADSKLPVTFWAEAVNIASDPSELCVQEKKDASDSKDTETAQNEEERGEKEDQLLTSEHLEPEMPALAEDDTDDENSSVFGGRSPEKNDSNLDAEINEETIHQTKVHKDRPPQ